MSSDTTNTRDQLSAVARQIRAYQEDQRLSDRELVKRFPGLGSDRTWARIAGGDLDNVDPAQWLGEYLAVQAAIAVIREHAGDDDPLYDDLTTVLDLRAAVAEAMRERGINRLVIMQGPQGSGKSTAAVLLRAKYGCRVRLCEATEIWKENANAMLGGMLAQYGVPQPPIPVAEKWAILVNKMNESRTCLIIDEAHHLGPKTLNLVKSLVNQTPGEIVLLAMATLWRRLETAAYEEARQLTQNRLLERIRMEGVAQADAEKILVRRLSLSTADARLAASAVRQAAGANGNLTFVKLVCRHAARLAHGEPVTPDHVTRAAARVVASR